MKIYLNNERTDVAKPVSLLDLLQSKNLEAKKGIAVALNNSVVGRKEWESTPLNENDNVIIISATKGG